MSELFSSAEYPFNDYEKWHLAHEDPRSLEVTALTSAEYLNAMQDPDTASISVTDKIGQKFDVPLATSIDNMHWYNKQYFQNAAVSNGLDPNLPIVYYDHIPDLFINKQARYISSLRPLLTQVAEARGLLVTDNLDANASQQLHEITLLTRHLDIRANDILPSFDPEPVHYHYASRAILADPTLVRKNPLSLQEAAQHGNATLEPGISAELILSDKDSETVWQYYKERFDSLTSIDPLVASSPKEELAALFKDERVVKLAQRIGGSIVSLTLYGDVRCFPWANQSYYQTCHPAEYEQGNVWFFPGAITKLDSGGNILPVMNGVGRIAEATGAAHTVISFVCNKVSRRPITAISNRALNQSGLITDTTIPVGQRIFRAFQLERGGQ